MAEGLQVVHYDTLVAVCRSVIRDYEQLLEGLREGVDDGGTRVEYEDRLEEARAVLAQLEG